MPAAASKNVYALFKPRQPWNLSENFAKLCSPARNRSLPSLCPVEHHRSITQNISEPVQYSCPHVSARERPHTPPDLALFYVFGVTHLIEQQEWEGNETNS